MLVEDTLRSSTQYLTAVRSFPRSTKPWNDLARCSADSSRRTAVRWITERETGGVLQPEGCCTKTGDRVVEVLHAMLNSG